MARWIHVLTLDVANKQRKTVIYYQALMYDLTVYNVVLKIYYLQLSAHFTLVAYVDDHGDCSRRSK